MPKEANLSSNEVKKLLRQSGLKARKVLGQHFLIDKAVLETIITAAELLPEDSVIEVGPGLGVLTVELARQAGHVLAVELDTKLTSFLKHRLSHWPNVTIINTDILKTSPSQLLKGRASYKVVANLPYYITSPVLHYFIEASTKPLLMVVTVQKEVGEAIVAGPGEMTALAVSLQVYSKSRIVAFVPPQSFYPPPKVDSAVVRFDLLPQPAVEVADIRSFLEFVRYGFRSPRKQLRNSLAQGLRLKPSEAASLLAEAGIESERRPATLNLKEWESLYQIAAASGKAGMLC